MFGIGNKQSKEVSTWELQVHKAPIIIMENFV